MNISDMLITIKAHYGAKKTANWQAASKQLARSTYDKGIRDSMHKNIRH
jgi:hypothetical protein